MKTERRIRLDLMTPAELGIYNVSQEVEKIGADLRLTEAITLLGYARKLVADYVDDYLQDTNICVHSRDEGTSCELTVCQCK